MKNDRIDSEVQAHLLPSNLSPIAHASSREIRGAPACPPATVEDKHAAFGVAATPVPFTEVFAGRSLDEVRHGREPDFGYALDCRFFCAIDGSVARVRTAADGSIVS
jgi:hypothetical protein